MKLCKCIKSKLFKSIYIAIFFFFVASYIHAYAPCGNTLKKRSSSSFFDTKSSGKGQSLKCKSIYQITDKSNKKNCIKSCDCGTYKTEKTNQQHINAYVAYNISKPNNPLVFVLYSNLVVS